MKEENIYNLTELWKTAGQDSGSYFESSIYKSSIVSNSEWPNRIWLNKDYDILTVKCIEDVMSSSKTKLTLPMWNISRHTRGIMSLHGLKLKFRQVGMSMKLNDKFEYEQRLNIKKVSTQDEIELWEDIYPDSFGYKISKEVILKSIEKINFYLVRLENLSIGTAITLKTNNVVGIHGVGVVPNARRKGFAEEIMKFIINESIDDGIGYSTLQASDMEKNIYLKLGFTEDFTIENYVLNNSFTS